MAVLNKVLSVLMVLLAITAAVFSWFLFERRTEFKGRADLLADTLARAVKVLDEESGTNVASSVSFVKGGPDQPESGTLGWQNYTENSAGFETNVKKALELVNTVHKQRDYLADGMATIGQNLGMPAGKAEAARLKRTDLVAETGEQIISQVRELGARDNAMIQTFITCGEIIGYPMAESVFMERVETADMDGVVSLGPFKTRVPLTEFTSHLQNMANRTKDYQKALTDVVKTVNNHNWETKPAKLMNPEDYSAAVVSIMNDFEGINDKLALLKAAQNEIRTMRQRMEDSESELDVLRKELHGAQAKIRERDKQIADRRTGPAIPRPNPDDDDFPREPLKIKPDLRGEVVKVNQDWNYVILDLGYEKVKSGVELLVARNDEFIARIQVTEVFKNSSIAEILPTIQTGRIQNGDRVILPKD